MKSLNAVGLPTLSVAAGATTPVPPEGKSLIYSLITNGMLLWDGTQWNNVAPLPSDLVPFSGIQTAGVVTYYLSPSGNDSNDGLTTGTAWASLYHASVIVNKIITDIGVPAVIQIYMATGTYNETQETIFYGYGGDNPQIWIQSTSGVTTDVVINYNLPLTYAIAIQSEGAYVDLNGLSINVLQDNFAICSCSNSGVLVIYNINCNTNGHIPANGVNGVFVVWDEQSELWMNGCAYTGNAVALVSAPNGGLIQFGYAHTFTGTPTYSNACFDIGNGANLNMQLVTWTGSFIGKKYSAYHGAQITTNPANSLLIPGTIEGTLSYGAHYEGDVSDLVEIKPYVSTRSYILGDQVIRNGILVTPNAAISAGTAFAWGTSGATWKPGEYASTWKGVWSASSTYSPGDVVVKASSGTVIYMSRYTQSISGFANPATANNLWVVVHGDVNQVPYVSQVSLTFGSSGNPVQSQIFTIAGVIYCTVGQKVIMVPAADLAGSSLLNSDEFDMDNFMCAAVVIGQNTVKTFITAFPGPVSGTYNFNLMVV